jgi:hypothetical protein
MAFAKQSESPKKKHRSHPHGDRGERIREATRIREGQEGKTGQHRAGDESDVRFDRLKHPAVADGGRHRAADPNRSRNRPSSTAARLVAADCRRGGEPGARTRLRASSTISVALSRALSRSSRYIASIRFTNGWFSTMASSSRLHLVGDLPKSGRLRPFARA